MSQALEAINKIKDYQQCNLSDLLLKMCHLGEPSIHKMRNGWWCKVDMHVSAKGSRFVIESDSNCDNPSEAARQCAGRALTILKQWS